MIQLCGKVAPGGTVTVSGARSWRVHTRRSALPIPGLVGPLRGLECGDGPPRTRLEVPTGLVDLLFVFDGKLAVGLVTADAGPIPHTSVIAGPRTHAAILEFGELRCVTVSMSPLLAARIAGVPLGELAGRALDPVDLFGPPAARLISRLGEAADWDSRFALVDGFLAHRHDLGAPVPAQVEAALRQAMAAEAPSPQELAARAGWSARHLRRQFLRFVGLPPHKVVMIARLQRALRMGQNEQLAAVAHRAGYHDQAHLVHDLSRFCGITPTQYRAMRFSREGRSVLIDRLPGYVTGVNRT